MEVRSIPWPSDPERSLVERDAAAFLHQRGASPVSRTVRAAQGVWVETEAGHRFMDFQGNSCHNVGYRHPRIVAALKEQIDRLPFAPGFFANEEATALAERLVACWPYGSARVLLGLSGADAIEMALKLAYLATGRRRTLALQDSWHGAALGALWAGGRHSERTRFPVFEGCEQALAFWPRQAGVTRDAAARDALADIAARLSDGGFACLLAEPIRSAPHVPPSWFWPEVRRLCDAAGTLLIFDEVPTGLGKTGRLFSAQHFEAAPDMTVLGKSLGGGAVPLSALIARTALNVGGDVAIGHYTHQKNPLLACAGLTTLDILHDEGLVEAAAAKGKVMLGRLEALVDRSPAFRSARGIGLLMAVELADGVDAARFKEACFWRGLYVGAGPGRSVTLSPPLMIDGNDLQVAADIMEDASVEVH